MSGDFVFAKAEVKPHDVPCAVEEPMVADSPLEEEGFEFGSHFQEARGTPGSPFRGLVPAASAAIVFTSESDDLELPTSQRNLARRAT